MTWNRGQQEADEIYGTTYLSFTSLGGQWNNGMQSEEQLIRSDMSSFNKIGNKENIDINYTHSNQEPKDTML